jgi:CRISPR-associated protein Cas2
MAEPRLWYLIAYDIRDHARWRKAYKLLRGFGERVQYSVFRVRLSSRQLEQLRWELERELAREDSLLIVGQCAGCVERIAVRNRPEDWTLDEPGWRIV